ncbi:hypothetical protein TNIN_44981 [Trichonephila inaurata madagascariensis]|uniref:Uncharacterized protein n=1 Tax=Trichonephila inaurata madagascariensis TaxID=2747483 RepID=A0A8X7BVK6_9ARAC|nr:hypothetical protein TNIN_44981 [Trichonephila inaurata madagascariensis]
MTESFVVQVSNDHLEIIFLCSNWSLESFLKYPVLKSTGMIAVLSSKSPDTNAHGQKANISISTRIPYKLEPENQLHVSYNFLRFYRSFLQSTKVLK